MGNVAVKPVGADPDLQREFMQFPKELYRDDPCYVPAFDVDMRNLLAQRHPFFLHSVGDFFILQRDGQTVGRFLIAENRRYNHFHGTDYTFFDSFDVIDDRAVAEAAFAAMTGWTQGRGMSAVVGPMLSGGTGGAGILVEGYDQLPAMTMMRYNPPYYSTLLEQAGFSKMVDLHSFALKPEALRLPERVERVAELVLKRGHFSVMRFTSKRQLRRVVGEVKELYSATFSHHLEDYPLSNEELDQVAKDLLTVIDPRHVALLAYDGKIVGFAFGFADLSRALQKNRGRIGPIEIVRLMSTMKRTGKILFNGLGILPEYQGLGGNALLYRELSRIITEGRFTDVEMVQISEQTGLMLRDAGTLGGKPYKVHRLYRKYLHDLP